MSAGTGIRALTKCYPDGTPYTRMESVEALLPELPELTFDEIVARCEITNRKHPDFLPPECVVYFLRNTRSNNSDARFNRIFEALRRRLMLALPRFERDGEGGTMVDGAMSDVNDLVRGRFVEIVTLDRHGGDRMDFYEVHFDEAVALLRRTASKKVRGHAFRHEAIELDPETNELPIGLERAAGSFDPPDDSILFDPIARSRVLAAIDALPVEQSRIMTMLMNNMNAESSKPGTPSISDLLGCDPKTVRARRNKAIAAIQKALGLGEDQ
jgi:hypothetical protein